MRCLLRPFLWVIAALPDPDFKGGGGALWRSDRKLGWNKLNRVGFWQWFDMAGDRAEMNAVAAAHPGRVADLLHTYRGWAERTNRPVPGTGSGKKSKA